MSKAITFCLLDLVQVDLELRLSTTSEEGYLNLFTTTFLSINYLSSLETTFQYLLL